MSEKEIIESFNKLLKFWQSDIPSEKITETPIIEFVSSNDNVINIKVRDDFLTDFKTLYYETFNNLFKNAFNSYEYIILNDAKKPNYYVTGTFNQIIIDDFSKQLLNTKTFHNEYVYCPHSIGRTTLIKYLISISNEQAKSFDLNDANLKNISDISKEIKIILLDNFESINTPQKISLFMKILSKLNYNKISVFMFSSVKYEEISSMDFKNFLTSAVQTCLFFPNVTKLKIIISQIFKKVSPCKLTDDALDFLSKLDLSENFNVLVNLLNKIAFMNSSTPDAIITQKDIENIISFKDTEDLQAKHIISSVCNIFNVNTTDILSFQKNKTIKDIRDGIVFLLRNKLKLEFKIISKLLKKSCSYVKTSYAKTTKNQTFVNNWNKMYDTQL